MFIFDNMFYDFDYLLFSLMFFVSTFFNILLERIQKIILYKTV
jgi:hypothetical protein